MFSSPRQTYIEFDSLEATSTAKHLIDRMPADGGHLGQKKIQSQYWTPHSNPFRTLPKDAPMRGKDQARASSSTSSYNDRGSYSSHSNNNNNNNFRGRGNFGGGRGGVHQNYNRGYNNNMGYNNNNNMGSNMQGAFGGPPPNNFGFNHNNNNHNNSNNRGNMMGGGMRGGPNMRGGRGGNMMPMNPMPPMGGMPGMGGMGGMGMGMPQNMGMGMMGPNGMPGMLTLWALPFTSFGKGLRLFDRPPSPTLTTSVHHEHSTNYLTDRLSRDASKFRWPSRWPPWPSRRLQLRS